MDNNMIRQALIQYMEDNGVKLLHVAEKAGIDYKYLSKFKSGSRNMGINGLTKISQFLEGK